MTMSRHSSRGPRERPERPAADAPPGSAGRQGAEHAPRRRDALRPPSSAFLAAKQPVEQAGAVGPVAEKPGSGQLAQQTFLSGDIAQKPPIGDNVTDHAVRAGHVPQKTVVPGDIPQKSAVGQDGIEDTVLGAQAGEQIVDCPALTQQTIQQPVFAAQKAAGQAVFTGNTAKETIFTAQQATDEAFVAQDTVQQPGFTAQQSTEETFVAQDTVQQPGLTAQQATDETLVAQDTVQQPGFTAQQSTDETFVTQDTVQQPGLTAQQSTDETFVTQDTVQQPGLTAQQSTDETFVAQDAVQEAPIAARKPTQETFIAEEPPKQPAIIRRGFTTFPHQAGAQKAADQPVGASHGGQEALVADKRTNQAFGPGHAAKQTAVPGHIRQQATIGEQRIQKTDFRADDAVPDKRGPNQPGQRVAQQPLVPDKPPKQTTSPGDRAKQAAVSRKPAQQTFRANHRIQHALDGIVPITAAVATIIAAVAAVITAVAAVAAVIATVATIIAAVAAIITAVAAVITAVAAIIAAAGATAATKSGKTENAGAGHRGESLFADGRADTGSPGLFAIEDQAMNGIVGGVVVIIFDEDLLPVLHEDHQIRTVATVARDIDPFRINLDRHFASGLNFLDSHINHLFSNQGPCQPASSTAHAPHIHSLGCLTHTLDNSARDFQGGATKHGRK